MAVSWTFIGILIALVWSIYGVLPKRWPALRTVCSVLTLFLVFFPLLVVFAYQSRQRPPHPAIIDYEEAKRAPQAPPNADINVEDFVAPTPLADVYPTAGSAASAAFVNLLDDMSAEARAKIQRVSVVGTKSIPFKVMEALSKIVQSKLVTDLRTSQSQFDDENQEILEGSLIVSVEFEDFARRQTQLTVFDTWQEGKVVMEFRGPHAEGRDEELRKTVKFVESPWLTDFETFSRRANSSFAIGISETALESVDQARRHAIEDALRRLDESGFHLPADEVDHRLSDTFVQQFDLTHGPVYQAAVLVNVADPIDIVDSRAPPRRPGFFGPRESSRDGLAPVMSSRGDHRVGGPPPPPPPPRLAGKPQTWLASTIFGLIGIFVLTGVFCLMVNTATNGYYTQYVVAAAVSTVIALILLTFIFMV